MINSRFKMNKLLKLLGEIWFYSCGILIVFLIFSNQNITIKDLLKCVFPISYNTYWFMTTYVIIYILTNWINKFLKSMTQKEYICLMGILIAIWSIMPTIMLGKIEFSNIDWFILLYMIGAYIKMYPNKYFDTNKKATILLIVLCLLSTISVFLLNKVNTIFEIDPLHFALPMNQVMVLLISICLFIIFKNLDIKDNKIINKFASCSLGVYLIHTQQILKYVIWTDIYKVNQFSNSAYLVLYEIFAVVSVYILCVIIDYIRQNTVEKIYMKLIDKANKILKHKCKIMIKN